MNVLKRSISQKILKIILILGVLFSILLLGKSLTYINYPDFSVYYDGTKTLFTGGDPYAAGHHYFAAFNNAPSIFLIFFLFTKMPIIIAGRIFAIFSFSCFAFGVYFLYRLFHLRFFSTISLLLILFITNFFPEKFTLGMGQINNVVFLLVILFIYFYEKKKDYLSGVFLGLAIAVKLFPLLILLYLIVTKKWRILSTSIGMLLLITGITYTVVQPHIFFYFFQTELPSLFNAMPKDYYNQALSGFFIRDFPTAIVFSPLRKVIEGLLVIYSLFLTWKFYKKGTTAQILCMSILITLTLIINAFSWQHHFVWLLFPYFVTFFCIRDNKLSWRFYTALLLSFLLVAGNLKNPSFFPIIMQSHVLYGAILLYILQIILLTKSLNVRKYPPNRVLQV